MRAIARTAAGSLARRGLFACISPVLLIACGSTSELEDFASDGCSLFPDRSLIDESDWQDCCLDHDIAYWQGGTREQRLQADETLRSCVLQKTGDENLAELMYSGVRMGGSPYFYNWYRWGYGWSYQRKYEPLTEEELRQVQGKLASYRRTLDIEPRVQDLR